MVRALITIALCLCLVCGAPGTAQAVEVGDYVTTDGAYDYELIPLTEEERIELYAIQQQAYQGTINTTYLQFFKDIVAGLPITDNYVFFRSDDRVYTMYTGDLLYTHGKFELIGEGKEYVITQTQQSSGSPSYYAFSSGVISGAVVSVGDKLVYSDLGDYPRLEERGVLFEFVTTFLLCVFACCALVRPIFNFVLRFRNGN